MKHNRGLHWGKYGESKESDDTHHPILKLAYVIGDQGHSTIVASYFLQMKIVANR